MSEGGEAAPRAEAISGRPGCLWAVGALGLGAAIVVVAALGLAARGAGAVDLGTAARYAPGSVVYRSTDGLFVVRPAEGALLALSDVDPHNPPGTRTCRVTYRPDLGAEGEHGRFFDICSGSMYDLAGRGLGGDGLNLRSVRVEEMDEGRLRAYPGPR